MVNNLRLGIKCRAGHGLEEVKGQGALVMDSSKERKGCTYATSLNIEHKGVKRLQSQLIAACFYTDTSRFLVQFMLD